MRTRPDQGGTTLYVVISIVAVFVVIGLVVDGGAMLRAYQRADLICREAARTAGQQVDFQADPVTVNRARAIQAGKNYLNAAGCQNGSVTISGRTITATCDLTYRVVFLNIGDYTAHGTGEAASLSVGP